jgi:hypothetical protein
VHLRTGLADFHDHHLRAAMDMADKHRAPRKRGASATQNWFRAGCDHRAFRNLSNGLILSDAPGLVRHLLSSYPQLFAADLSVIWEGIGGNGSGPVSSRSWGNQRAPKLAAAIDATSAGLATEVQFSRYSTMLKPAVARSMCTRRLVIFPESPASLCPRFDVAFFRNMHLLTQDSQKWACLQQQLAQHPCKGRDGNSCTVVFTTAMV